MSSTNSTSSLVSPASLRVLYNIFPPGKENNTTNLSSGNLVFINLIPQKVGKLEVQQVHKLRVHGGSINTLDELILNIDFKKLKISEICEAFYFFAYFISELSPIEKEKSLIINKELINTFHSTIEKAQKQLTIVNLYMVIQAYFLVDFHNEKFHTSIFTTFQSELSTIRYWDFMKLIFYHNTYVFKTRPEFELIMHKAIELCKNFSLEAIGELFWYLHWGDLHLEKTLLAFEPVILKLLNTCNSSHYINSRNYHYTILRSLETILRKYSYLKSFETSKLFMNIAKKLIEYLPLVDFSFPKLGKISEGIASFYCNFHADEEFTATTDSLFNSLFLLAKKLEPNVIFRALNFRISFEKKSLTFHDFQKLIRHNNDISKIPLSLGYLIYHLRLHNLLKNPNNPYFDLFMPELIQRRKELTSSNIENIILSYSEGWIFDKAFFKVILEEALSKLQPSPENIVAITKDLTKLKSKLPELLPLILSVEIVIERQKHKITSLTTSEGFDLKNFHPAKRVEDIIDTALKKCKILNDEGKLLPPYCNIALQPLSLNPWKRYVQLFIETIRFENNLGEYSDNSLASLLIYVLENSDGAQSIEEILTIGSTPFKKIFTENNFEYLKDFLHHLLPGLEKHLTDDFELEGWEQECDHDIRTTYKKRLLTLVEQDAELLSNCLDSTRVMPLSPTKKGAAGKCSFVATETILPLSTKNTKVQPNSLVIAKMKGVSFEDQKKREIDVTLVSEMGRKYSFLALGLPVLSTVAALRKCLALLPKQRGPISAATAQTRTTTIFEHFQFTSAPKIIPVGLGDGNPVKAIISFLTKTRYVDSPTSLNKYAFSIAILESIRGVRENSEKDLLLMLESLLAEINHKDTKKKAGEITRLLAGRYKDHSGNPCHEASICVAYKACEAIQQSSAPELTDLVWRNLLVGIKTDHPVLKVIVELSSHRIPFTYIQAYMQLQVFVLACAADKDAPVKDMEVILSRNNKLPAFFYRIKRGDATYRLFIPFNPLGAIAYLTDNDEYISKLKLAHPFVQPSFKSKNNSEVLFHLSALGLPQDKMMVPFAKSTMDKSGFYSQVTSALLLSIMAIHNNDNSNFRIDLNYRIFITGVAHLHPHFEEQNKLIFSLWNLKQFKGDPIAVNAKLKGLNYEKTVIYIYEALLDENSVLPKDELKALYTCWRRHTPPLNELQFNEVGYICFMTMLDNYCSNAFEVFVLLNNEPSQPSQNKLKMAFLLLMKELLSNKTQIILKAISNIVTFMLKDKNGHELLRKSLHNVLIGDKPLSEPQVDLLYNALKLLLNQVIKLSFIMDILRTSALDDRWKKYCKTLFDIVHNIKVIPEPSLYQLIEFSNTFLASDPPKEFRDLFMNNLLLYIRLISISLPPSKTLKGIHLFICNLLNYQKEIPYIDRLWEHILNYEISPEDLTTFSLWLKDNSTHPHYLKFVEKILSHYMQLKDIDNVILWKNELQKDTEKHQVFFISQAEPIQALVNNTHNIQLLDTALEAILLEKNPGRKSRQFWDAYIAKCEKEQKYVQGAKVLLFFQLHSIALPGKSNEAPLRFATSLNKNSGQQRFALLLLNSFNIQDPIVWTYTLNPHDDPFIIPDFPKIAQEICQDGSAFDQAFNNDEDAFIRAKAYFQLAELCKKHGCKNKEVIRFIEAKMQHAYSAFSRWGAIKRMFLSEFSTQLMQAKVWHEAVLSMR